MDVTPLIPEGRQIIQSYQVGGFKISGVRYEGGVLVSPEATIAWPVTNIESLTPDDFAILEPRLAETDVILLGTGKKMSFLSPALRNGLAQKNIRVEAMDTGAACRTYNVLMAEGRRVAAVMMPVL